MFRPDRWCGPCSAIALAALVILVGSEDARSTSIPLRPERPIERPLQAGESHHYDITLEENQGFYLRVDQIGIDVLVILENAGGTTLLQRDSLNRREGPEELWFVGAAGRYRAEVRPYHGETRGRYRIGCRTLDPPDELDRQRAQAIALLFAPNAQSENPKARLETVRAIWRETGETLQEALVLYRLGDHLLEKRGDRVGALRAYETARELFDQLGEKGLQIDLMHCLGRVHRLFDNRTLAWRYQEEALELSQQHGYPLREAVSLNNLALLSSFDGDHRVALQSYGRALEIYRQLGDEGERSKALLNLGLEYSRLAMLPEALTALEESLTIHRALDMPGQALILAEIGWTRHLQGQARKAVEIFDRALELERPDAQVYHALTILDRRGTAQRALGHWDAAVTDYEQALIGLIQSGTRRDIAATLLNLTELYVDWERREQALTTSEVVLDLLADLGPDNEAHVRYLRARAYLAADDLDKARREIEQGLDQVEKLRDRLARQALALPFYQFRRIYYELYIDLLMRLQARETTSVYSRLAFEAQERARARDLLDSLVTHQNDPHEVKELRRRLNQLDLKQRQLQGAEQRRTTLEIDHLLRQLAERKSRHHGAPLIEEPLDLAGLERLLEPDTLFLVYSLGEDRSFLWALSADLFASFELPSRREIETRSRHAYELLLESRRVEYEGASHLAAKRISEILLEPVAQLLESDRLVILSDGALHYLPFAALPDPRDGKPLILRHEIVRLPSLSVLAALRRRAESRQPPTGTLAIVADPVFERDDERVRLGERVEPVAPLSFSDQPLGSLANVRAERFSRLPASRREAEQILAMVPESQRWVALDFAASRETVLAGRLADFRLLHIASHTLLHDRHPELSGIVLSRVDEAGESRDGFLRAHEIAALDLASELVVLSACRTALGDEMQGEGLLGMPRSFFNAGADRVIVSLWNVEDEATAELMARFYRRLLEEGLRPADALRQAQLSMLDEARWRAPFHWAGFELQGDWR